MRPLKHLVGDRRAAVAPVAALVMGAVLGFAALAIDFGAIFLQTRQLQGDADLAAIAAANDLANAQAAASATANANGWSYPVTTTAVTGAYVADSTVPAGQRFTAGSASPNAVKVTLKTKADLFFGASVLGVQTLDITRTATAATAQLASFSIGSRLAAVQGGVANAVLQDLTGSQVSLSVMDYNALASANVDLLQYSQALQTDMKLQGATFDSVLSTKTVSQNEALKVLGNVLTTAGDNAAGTAMQKLATASSLTNQAHLDQVLDLGPYGQQDHAEPNSGAGIAVNALSMATAMLELGQGGHQAELQLGANVPGLSNVNLWLAIGQRPSNSPWLTVTDDNSVIIRTAQARIYADSALAPGALSLIGVRGVDVPIYVELASAEAKLSALTCPSNTNPSAVEAATLSVAPSVGQIAIAQIDTSQLSDFTNEPTLSPATLISVQPLVTATAYADVNLGGADWQDVSFSQSDIQAGTVKTVATNNIASATVDSLLSSLHIGVSTPLGPLAVGGLDVGSILGSALNGASSSLDTVIDSATDLLGVKLGEADVWVNGVRCHNAALVA